ncbi:TIGR03364 family FAD-dependent oxidoreductase [Arcticibacter eurypsychrophilus]|uniref:TIGR03364 family FAD-dependent oxidoreductase n=1 Tax=Arcticibacter eurypsychrophilus TaxID=1434752 RepID=UPI00084CF598|nr:TIGR03364 family FAD-dependent oxidoreductase [Arcticibacter eurypsychrophilus]
MHIKPQQTVLIIGAGIVGLASARAFALKGYKVTVFERYSQAIGASIRNFGMIWPVGQAAGDPYNTAIQSRDIWKSICEDAGIWYRQSGSLHLAYNATELAVMEEYAAAYAADRPCSVLTAAETLAKSEAVNPDGLIGALWNADELIVDPRLAISRLASYLEEKLQVEFKWNTLVTHIEKTTIYTGDRKKYQADMVVVCSGADFETLYPRIYSEIPITKCKLQMMRLAAQPGDWSIGSSLCGSLSALHYAAFQVAPSLSSLRQLADEYLPEYGKLGIHVMVSQNGNGELTIGDSHEYGLNPDPFDREHINALILNYLKTFARFKDWKLLQSWNGVYAKMTNGDTCFQHSPEEGVLIFNATGGAGMTLSFGLAERMIQQL